jgi:hypothetical protein
MINEGRIVEDRKARVRSVMVQEIRRLGPTTANEWQEKTYQALTGIAPENLDLSDEETGKVYFTWVRTFDGLVDELIDDGYVTLQEREGEWVLVPTAEEEATHFASVPLGSSN